MQRVVFMLACFSYPVHLSRVQTTNQGMQHHSDIRIPISQQVRNFTTSLDSLDTSRQSRQKKHQKVLAPLKAFAQILLALNPAVAFTPSCLGVGFPLGSRNCFRAFAVTQSGDAGSTSASNGHAADLVIGEQPRLQFDIRSDQGMEIFAASKLVQEAFEEGNALQYVVNLRFPELQANMLFNPTANIIPVALQHQLDATDSVIGVAQLMRVTVSKKGGEIIARGNRVTEIGKNVGFIQRVAVAKSARRQGVARAMMAWCEKTALAEWGTNELLLAVYEDNVEAIALYKSLGYEQIADLSLTRGQAFIMRKSLQAEKPVQKLTVRSRSSDIRAALEPSSPGEEYRRAERQLGLGWKPLLTNMGWQAFLTATRVVGISVALAPYGGPSLFTLFGSAPLWDAYPWAGNGAPSAPLGTAQPFIEILLGCAFAWLDLRRSGIGGPGVTDSPQASAPTLTEDAGGNSEQGGDWLNYTFSEADQKRALYEVVGGESQLWIVALAIIPWIGLAAVSEEIYYRGFVESFFVFVLSYPAELIGTPGILLGELGALFLSAVLFGLAHTEFDSLSEQSPTVEQYANSTTFSLEPFGGGEKADTKEFWFRETFRYGAAFSGLYILSGHRLLAPACAHAGINIGICLHDWGQMRRTPVAVLQRIFDKAEVEK